MYLKDCARTKSLVDDLVVTYDEIEDTTETILIKSVHKKGHYLLYTIFLANICLILLMFITINFYCYYIKQLPPHNYIAIGELKETNTTNTIILMT